ncbi:uncharacterized protein LOC143782087 [Ranitomeya variabilis]|uniref:uncharacterized protein LOC143782087 n=1 Tax=Ranitomeya variabilis TaxID=490064 RepID=UPI004055C9A8
MERLFIYAHQARLQWSSTIWALQLRQRQFHKWSTESFFIWTTQPETQHPPRRRPTRRATRKPRTHDYEVTGKAPNSVINISSYTLSPAELLALQKGLSFCPTPTWDKFKLTQDLQRFYRSLRLKTHFGLPQDSAGNRTSTTVADPIPELSIINLGLRSTSTYNPPRTNHATEAYIDLIQRDINTILEQHRLGGLPTHSNISPVEKQAIESLRSNKKITIKPADKGGAIVVQNTADYSAEILRQLSDTTTYQRISSDPTPNIKLQINNILQKYQALNILDSKTSHFLTNPHPVTPVIYTLPKIHKSLINPPGRPIVASTDSILAPISIYLEKILTPLTKNMRSFILDTGHFLQILKQFATTPPDCILVTFDVKSLYTSIKHDLGIAAVGDLLEQSAFSHHSKQFCIDLLSLILRNNFFLFGDQYYLQTQGTAMGANVAPAYANTYMDSFEKEYVYNNLLFRSHSLCWLRYIDDVFCLWTGPLDSLMAFSEQLNSVRAELQFTLNFSTSQISFLDTMIIRSPTGKLSTDLFSKPTDTNSLLHYQSCHPLSTKNSLPRSQFKRVARIVSNSDVLPTRLDNMSLKFAARHYPSSLLAKEKQCEYADLLYSYFTNLSPTCM